MFARDVREGLTKPGQKELPCQYFYDEVGTALFEAITVLPEYGLTRADMRLIRRLSPELARRLRPPAAVAELGSGSGSKTRWILESLANDGPLTYYPIDVSRAALARCAQELAGFGEVVPIEDSYLNGLRQVVCNRRAGQALLVLFLGSTIGNFARAAAQEFLSDVRGCLLPGDALLLGTDLVKPVPCMLRAYDDPAGVTAAFNLNLLARINRELDADFDLRQFEHAARYSSAEQRIEMHLRSRQYQIASVRGADLIVDFVPDETICTEVCHKFLPEQLCTISRISGFRLAAQWVDEEWPFAESLLVAV
jgi:L-histidine Nalpha-methyltransferase